MPVIVGGVIEKDGKYLLVQEAKKCRGKWNLPGGEIIIDKDEIMDVKWFSYDEILKLRDNDEIRTPDLLVGAINNARSGLAAPLELVNMYAGVLR